MVMLRFSRICLLTTLLHQIHGYVLFAANLDDFRSIAKKFIPEKLADQLAEMASESSVKYHKKAEEKDAEYEYDESEGDGVTTPYTHREIVKSTAKKRYIVKKPIPEVNIDELVEKVRERLFKGKQKNQKAIIDEKKTKILNGNEENKRESAKNSYNVKNKVESITYEPENVNYDQNYEENTEKDQKPNYEYVENEKGTGWEPDYDVTTKRQKPRSKPKVDKAPKNYKEEDYEESVKDPTPNQYDEGKIFQEVDLRNTNDSYEDYVTPDREKIFESEETTTKQTTFRQTVKKRTERSYPKDYEDVKARTESLLYDEKEVRVNRTIDGAFRHSKTKKGKGTMIPTRQYYKMSSPDYYKKLPVIAEKYNFDEPLPEKDREPENLKPIGNPPAKINKKVRL